MHKNISFFSFGIFNLREIKLFSMTLIFLFEYCFAGLYVQLSTIPGDDLSIPQGRISSQVDLDVRTSFCASLCLYLL